MIKLNVTEIGLGLMKGDLTANIEKNGKKFVRKLNPDRTYISTKWKKNYSSWKSFVK